MTIGPEPIRQIERRSSRRGSAHLLQPAPEERTGVVGAGPRLGVELHRGGAELGIAEALASAVVERDVARLRVVAGDREAVVLAGHEHAAARALKDRVVGAAMAEAELEGRPPGREREQLVSEADAEDRHTAEERAHRLD